MYIKRILSDKISEHLFGGKVIILLGARQVGKTTLLEELVRPLDVKRLRINCDEAEVRDILNRASTGELDMLVSDNKVIMIDEAQRVDGIGLTLKVMHERHPEVQFLVIGSSSLNLRNRLDEPLTGRKYEYTLYPLSTMEIYDYEGLIRTRQSMESRLVCGSYPEIFTHPENAIERLKELADSYLYKDIFEIDKVRKPGLLMSLVQALAWQVGSEVSYNELAKTIGTDSKTVERYVDLLEKCYVIFRLPGLSRNMRAELKRAKKIYFCDTGIRNAVISNFAPVARRNDMGALWENFFICERMKKNSYEGRRVNYYFWRTTTQQEIDLIEECDGEMTAFELKWNPKRKASFPKSFLEAYNVVASHVVSRENALDFIL